MAARRPIELGLQAAKGSTPMITPKQLQEARRLLGWPRVRLAAEASHHGCYIPERTVQLLEHGDARVPAGKLAAIRAALERAGVEFTDQNGGGPGVRLRRPGSA